MGQINQANFLKVIRGSILKNVPVTTEIRLILFKNEEEEEIQIQAQLFGHLYTIKRYPNQERKSAIKFYKELVKEASGD